MFAAALLAFAAVPGNQAGVAGFLAVAPFLGLGASVSLPSLTVMVAEAVPARRVGLATGLTAGRWHLAALAGVPAAAWVFGTTQSVVAVLGALALGPLVEAVLVLAVGGDGRGPPARADRGDGRQRRVMAERGGEEIAVNITLNGASEAFVEQLVQSGQYASPQEVVDGLVQERQKQEVKLAALRASIGEAMAEDDLSEEEFFAAIDATIEDLKRTYP